MSEGPPGGEPRSPSTGGASDAADRPPTGRLAPSPTGRLHLGHARSFLLAWCSARARGGRVVLRVDDLDGPRCREEFVAGLLEDLDWLGLDWDGPPARQSEHGAAYAAALERLEARGALYACVCTRAEIRSARSAPQAGAGEARYPGTCRDRHADAAAAEAATGRTAGLRLRVPAGPVVVRDALAGESAHDVAAEVGDFLVARRDGAVAYQLAVVVDDDLQGVDEVIRGDDLLPSAARQALLMDLLDVPRPRWAHVPLLTDAAGTRLAKRTDALALASLRAAGVDPRAVVGWLAEVSGQPASPRATPAELLASFDLQRLPRAPVPVPDDVVERLRARG